MSESDVNNIIGDLYKRLEPLLNNTNIIDEKTKNNFKNLGKIIAEASVKTNNKNNTNDIKELVPYDGPDYVLVDKKSKKKGVFLGIDLYENNSILFDNILMIIIVIFFVFMMIFLISRIPVYLWPIIFLIVEYLIESYVKSMDIEPAPVKKEIMQQQLKNEVSNAIKIKEKEEKEQIILREQEKVTLKRQEEYDRRSYDERSYDRYDRRYEKSYDRYDRRRDESRYDTEYYYKGNGVETGYYYKRSEGKQRYDNEKRDKRKDYGNHRKLYD